MKISAIIISKNEEKNISECINNISWVDEIIIVDNGSEDDTLAIARKKKVKIFTLKNANFSQLRNFGARKAKCEWLLFIDADERVTQDLKKEIEDKIEKNSPDLSGYAIPRKNILLGQEMKHGGWWPDFVMRLIKKDALKGYEGKVHEQPLIKGQIGKLNNFLIHTTHESIDEMVTKTNEWSEIEAQLLFDAGHPKMNIFRFLSAMFREFWYRGIIKMGFLDGVVGIIEIIYQMFSKGVTYAKLWELQLKNIK